MKLEGGPSSSSRAGFEGIGGGKVTALVGKRDKVLADGIERAVKRGGALDGVTSRKSEFEDNLKVNSSLKERKAAGRKSSARPTIVGGSKRFGVVREDLGRGLKGGRVGGRSEKEMGFRARNDNVVLSRDNARPRSKSGPNPTRSGPAC